MSSKAVKFIHLRYNNVMDDSVSSKGGVTIAFESMGHSGDSSTYINYAFSECNPVDNFDRRKGRVVAAGRLKSADYVKRIVIAPGATIKEQVQAVKEDYMNYKERFLPNARTFLGWYARGWE